MKLTYTIGAAICASLVASESIAQDFPKRPINLIAHSTLGVARICFCADWRRISLTQSVETPLSPTWQVDPAQSQLLPFKVSVQTATRWPICQ